MDNGAGDRAAQRARFAVSRTNEATPIGAIRIAASQELQLPAPRVMLTDAHGQGGQLSTEPSHQLRPVGRADPSDTRIEVLPPLGAESQHVLANEASPASILACPNVGPAAYSFAAAQMRSRRGQTPSANEWRRAPHLRSQWWLCSRCNIVNRSAATVCSRCASTVSEMTPYAAPAETAALMANAQRTLYGRSLRSVQGREQELALAVAQTPGSIGYAEAVHTQAGIFQVGSERLEEMVPHMVSCFDGWLALVTDGLVRFWTRDDVRAFLSCGQAEALTKEYILSWGRVVDVGGEEQSLIVQATPKGGFWIRALSFLNERHVHIVRALLSLVPNGAEDGDDWERRVLYGPFPDDVYKALAAVTTSLFAMMAVYERGPRGRARRERVPGVPPDSPSLKAFVDAKLRVPRNLVAELCRMAGSLRTSERLVVLERARVKTNTRRCFMLLQGRTPGGVSMTLFRIDGRGARWVPHSACAHVDAARAEVAAFEGQLLPQFGLHPLALSSETDQPLPLLPAEKHTCASCGVQRVRCAFSGKCRRADDVSQRGALTADDLAACLVCLDANGCTNAKGRAIVQRVKRWRNGLLSVVDQCVDDGGRGEESPAQGSNGASSSINGALPATPGAGVDFAGLVAPGPATEGPQQPADDPEEARQLEEEGDAMQETDDEMETGEHVVDEFVAQLGPEQPASTQGGAPSGALQAAAEPVVQVPVGDETAPRLTASGCQWRCSVERGEAALEEMTAAADEEAMAAWWGRVSGADLGSSGPSSEGDFTEEGAQPAEAPCCHGVQGCCTYGRPGAVLCKSHAEEVFIDHGNDWRAAAARGDVTVIGNAVPIAAASSRTSQPGLHSVRESSAEMTPTPLATLTCMHCRAVCSSEIEMCTSCNRRVRRVGARLSRAAAVLPVPAAGDADSEDEYLPTRSASRQRVAPSTRQVRASPAGAPTRRRPRNLVELAVDAGAHLARSAVTPHTYDMSGAETPFVRSALIKLLQGLNDHACLHASSAVNFRPLFRGLVATVGRTLGADNTRRAIALDDRLMQEAWMCFDPDYAPDLQMMAMTAFGEIAGPRYSDCFVAIRSHFEPEFALLNWYRFAGKNNKQVKRRKRGLTCREGCPCATAEGRARFRPGDTFVQRDEFGIHPETRCGVWKPP